MIRYILSPILTFFLYITFFSTTYAQEAIEPKPSPMAIAKTKKGDTYVKVVYSQPHKRGRKIFGWELAPYGKAWRLGANEATEITLTDDIKVGGKKLPAGTYSMYAIPEEDQWTVIFSSMLGEWGAYNYDETQDVLRVKAPVQSSDVAYEPFTIMFNEQGTELTMVWDKTKVALPITL